MAGPPPEQGAGARAADVGPPAAGLSIVVPVFNEAAGLASLHDRLADCARAITARRCLRCEIVYVDDGSTDATHTVAAQLPASGVDVQVVSFSRNFGKEAALLAGLDHARFGAILFIDGDGQHPPALIETLVGHWLDDGYDVVFAAKVHRGNESISRRIGVKAFYALINWGARHRIPEDASDFRLLSPRATAALRQMPERNRFFKGLASFIGFRQKRIDYSPDERAHGTTSWNTRALLGLSVEALTSFSIAPLRIASLLGLLLAFTALVFGVWMLIEAFVYEYRVPGYPSLIVGLMVIGGVQLLMIGIVGEYIGKILSEIKARPVYFVAEHTLRTAAQAHTESARTLPHTASVMSSTGRTDTPARYISINASSTELSRDSEIDNRDLVWNRFRGRP